LALAWARNSQAGAACTPVSVIPGLVPGIHAVQFNDCRQLKRWGLFGDTSSGMSRVDVMAGTSPAIVS
jgi:hypothetical protein